MKDESRKKKTLSIFKKKKERNFRDTYVLNSSRNEGHPEKAAPEVPKMECNLMLIRRCLKMRTEIESQIKIRCVSKRVISPWNPRIKKIFSGRLKTKTLTWMRTIWEPHNFFKDTLYLS